MTHQKRTYRKFIASTAAATLVASVVAPVASAAAYKDVAPKYKEAIDFVSSKGVEGFSKTEFGINKNIKRVDAAVMLAKVLGIENQKAPNSGFTDVPKRAQKAVNALKHAGITSGKTDKSFGSNDNITRGELSIWIQKGFELKGTSQLAFEDVSNDYKEAVGSLVNYEITKGISEKQFGITNPAKRGDFAIFLHKAHSAPDFKLNVIHTNDTHANIENAPRKITAIKQTKATNSNHILLDGGDVLSGTLYYNLYKGQADLEFMNLAGYDAMTFGNHEFDEGTGPLADFVKNAKFPFVSANTDFSKDPLMQGLAKNNYSSIAKNGEIYKGIVKTINGEKVGVFGLTTEETPSISSPGSVAFQNYIEAAEKSVAEFEKQGVNKIIALTHIGYNDGGGDNDLLLANHVEGIDMIVGGHSHTKLDKPEVINKFAEPTIIVQANEYTKFLGTLSVGFDEKGKIISHDGKLIELDAKVNPDDKNSAYVFANDPEAEQILNTKYKPEVDKKKKEIVAKSTVELLGGNPAARTGETNLGNLIADGMLAKAKTINPNTVIALQNGGGVRTTLPAGDISIADVLTVLPFGNALGIMEITGAEIVGALEHSVKNAPAANGAFLQIAGMKYEYDSSKPSGERVVSVEVMKDGKFTPLSETEKYTVATNIFTARGGDGYDVFKKVYSEGRVSEPGFVDWEIFMEYLKSQPDQTISPQVEGRIIDIAAKQ